MREKDRLVLLKNCLLINGKDDQPVEKAAVLIRGFSIIQSGSAKEVAVEKGQKVKEVDLKGRTVMPGLIDVHFHAMYSCFATMFDMELKDSIELATLKAARNLLLKLQSGFTSVRDVGCRGNMAVALREAVKDGLVAGPRIKASAQIISSTAGLTDWLPPWAIWKDTREGLGITIDGPDEALRAARVQVRAGVDNVKLGASGTAFNPFCPPRRVVLTIEELTAAAEYAHSVKKTVAVHAEATEAVKLACKAKADTIEHGMFLDNECIKLLKHNDVVLVPTLANYRSYFEKGPSTGVMPEVITQHKNNHQEHVESFRKAYDAKIRIALGTDSGGSFFPHENGAYELELFVRYGMKEMDAIKAGTRVGAEAMGSKEITGTIEPGKSGDLLIINGNPLKDIKLLQNHEKIAVVMKEGNVVKGGF